MPYRHMEPRFPFGEVYASATAAERLAEDALLQILHRHHCGDWGDLGEGDKRANERRARTPFSQPLKLQNHLQKGLAKLFRIA